MSNLKDVYNKILEYKLKSDDTLLALEDKKNEIENYMNELSIGSKLHHNRYFELYDSFNAAKRPFIKSSIIAFLCFLVAFLVLSFINGFGFAEVLSSIVNGVVAAGVSSVINFKKNLNFIEAFMRLRSRENYIGIEEREEINTLISLKEEIRNLDKEHKKACTLKDKYFEKFISMLNNEVNERCEEMNIKDSITITDATLIPEGRRKLVLKFGGEEDEG